VLTRAANRASDDRRHAALRRALEHAAGGRWREARTLLEPLYVSGDRDPQLVATLGVVRLEAGDADGAVDVLVPLAERPQASAADRLNAGNALVSAGRAVEAIPLFLDGVRQEPTAADQWYGLGRALQVAGRAADAEGAYRRSLGLNPHQPVALANLAAVVQFLGRSDEAERLAAESVSQAPSYDGGYFNLAIAQLAQRKWRSGFSAYEWRWNTPMMAQQWSNTEVTSWEGAPILDGALLVRAEQGFGDTLNFCRWISAARARVGRVVLQVPAPLVRLMAQTGVADEVVAFGEPIPAVVAQVALLSLPHRLGLDTDELVFGRPVLFDVPAREPSLPSAPAGVRRIGIVWAGSPTHVNDMHRSIPIEMLAPLLEVPGVQWVSLQPGAGATLRAASAGSIDAAEWCADFADTACIVRQLDAVVSVDTAAAHLAAGLGVETHLLLPPVGVDWRWGHDGTRTPWYPSMQLHRASHVGGWAPVIAALAAQLARTTHASEADVRAMVARAAAAMRSGDWPVAFDLLRRASAASPADAVLANNLCVAARNARAFPEAVRAGQRATQLAPHRADGWVNLANALVAIGDEPAAVEASARAVALAPSDDGINAAHARTLERANQPDEACARFDALLAQHPHDASLRYNRALAHLKAGRWRQGFADYEARWSLPTQRAWRERWPSIPVWDGHDIRGRTLLVRHEQGAGDTIMAARWIPALLGRGARVVCQVPRSLVSLLAAQWEQVAVVALDEPVDADVLLPTLSIPRCLALDDPSCGGRPYLRAPVTLADAAPSLVAARGADARPLVGVVWAGTPEHPYDHLRSRPLSVFAPLLADRTIRVVSLQVGPAAAEWAGARAVAEADGAIDASPALADYATTAALLMTLSRLVTVDTSVAHLAGALGVPTTILLPRSPDWRWGMFGTSTPWYQSATLWRTP
jgi:tetratricopeptide (TPR) repeat protein